MRLPLFGAALYLVFASRSSKCAPRGGRPRPIVNISSVGGKIAVPHIGAILRQVNLRLPASPMRSAPEKLARDNICVTTVAPGMMRTGSQVSRGVQRRSLRREYKFGFDLSSKLAIRFPSPPVTRPPPKKSWTACGRGKAQPMSCPFQAYFIIAANAFVS